MHRNSTELPEMPRHRSAVMHGEISVTGLYVIAALVLVALAVGIVLCCVCDCSKGDKADQASKDEKNNKEREDLKEAAKAED